MCRTVSEGGGGGGEGEWEAEDEEKRASGKASAEVDKEETTDEGLPERSEGKLTRGGGVEVPPGRPGVEDADEGGCAERGVGTALSEEEAKP